MGKPNLWEEKRKKHAHVVSFLANTVKFTFSHRLHPHKLISFLRLCLFYNNDFDLRLILVEANYDCADLAPPPFSSQFCPSPAAGAYPLWHRLTVKLVYCTLHSGRAWGWSNSAVRVWPRHSYQRRRRAAACTRSPAGWCIRITCFISTTPRPIPPLVVRLGSLRLLSTRHNLVVAWRRKVIANTLSLISHGHINQG